MNSSLDLKDKYYKIIDDWINGFTIDKIKIYLFSEPIIKLPISDTEIEENDIILQEKVLLKKLLGLDKHIIFIMHGITFEVCILYTHQQLV